MINGQGIQNQELEAANLFSLVGINIGNISGNDN
jgi:hypothetical protein